VCYYLSKDGVSIFQTKEKKERRAIIENTVTRYLGKTLFFPHTDPEYFSEQEYFAAASLPLKVVLFLDGSCSVCLLKMNFWREFNKDLRSQGYNEIPIVVYAYIGSAFEAIFREQHASQWEYAWQFDQAQTFISGNELYDARFQTVLVGLDNKILLIGDPTLNPKMRKLYMETILTYN